jgi:hypothetical protein
MEPPTALLSPGFILLLIAGGRLLYYFCTLAAERSGGRYDWTSTRHRPPCGRPCWTEEGRGTRPPDSYPLVRPWLFGQSDSGGQYHELQRPTTGRWRIKWRSCADGPAGRDSSGGQLSRRVAKPCQVRRSSAGVCFYGRGAKTAHLSSCQTFYA